MAKKEFTYRGKSTEELLKLDTREFGKLLPSKRKRCVLRNFQDIENFVKRCKTKLGRGKRIKTQARDIIVVPQMVGMKIEVYNGKEYVNLNVVWDMIGHRLGEFSPTRKKVAHSAPGIGATRSSAALSVK